MSGRTYYVDGNGTAHQIKKMFYTNGSGETVQIKKDFFEDKNTFSSAYNVVFHIDTNNTQTVEIDDGQDVIANAPTATKSGWTFRGWREDATATTAVVSSKVCDNDNIVMYAVFQRTLTVSYNGNGATSGSTADQTGTQYYNNSNYANPTFTLRSNGFAKANATSGSYEYKYTFANWRLNSASGTAYGVGASYTASANTTFYASWTATAVKQYVYGWMNITSEDFIVGFSSDYSYVNMTLEVSVAFPSGPYTAITRGQTNYTIAFTPGTYTTSWTIDSADWVPIENRYRIRIIGMQSSGRQVRFYRNL